MKPIYYDIFIVLGIISGAVLWYVFLLSLPLLSLVFLLLTLTLIWGSFIEPQIITTNRVSISLQNISHTVKIAVLTDLHAGPYKKADFFEKVVERVFELNPDIVVLVGDHVYNCVPNSHEVFELAPFARLAKAYPIYAVHGNHEYGADEYEPTKYTDVSVAVKQTLESYGITYLQNETREIIVKDQKLSLFGGDEVWADKLDFTSLEIRNRELPTIALIHNPAYLFHSHPPSIDLTISGHTHGGQICVPLFGSIPRVDSLIPRKWYYGLHTPEKTGEYLYVSRGLGESEPRARLCCPPEIALITLSSQKDQT